MYFRRLICNGCILGSIQIKFLAIIEKGDDLPRGWKPKIPDLSQPYETEDDEVIAEEGKIIVDSLEEE